MTDKVSIGFVEECESWRLSSRFFPSKIGGKPAWLNLKNIPSANQLACDYCKDPCVFLCQLYAPYDNDEAFHRTIFVFICKNSDCCKENQSGNIKVLRSQLKRENEFYPPNPPVEEKDWRTDISVDKWSKSCSICGIFSSKKCAKCKKVNYCSRSHQIWDWKNGHKSSCDKEQPENSSEKFLFPEYELVKDMEDYDQKLDNTCTEDEIKKFEELIKTGTVGTLQSEKDIDDDLLRMANNDIKDKTFFKFKERIKNDPDQVIRYNRGGKPLYISLSNQPQDIPKCECGSERQFEFQIMPQLLIYLKLENILNNIDWGIILIYTCKESCTTESKYMQEFWWKQDIVEESSENNE